MFYYSVKCNRILSGQKRQYNLCEGCDVRQILYCSRDDKTTYKADLVVLFSLDNIVFSGGNWTCSEDQVYCLLVKDKKFTVTLDQL